MASARAVQRLKAIYPWIKAPIIVSAPMRVFAGPDLAVATSCAGGLGFIGPGVQPGDLEPKLEKAKELLVQNPIHCKLSPASTDRARSTSPQLPIGVGFQLFDGDLEVAAAAIQKYNPAVAWLFVPANGQSDVDRWSSRIRKSSENIQIWLQIGSVAEAVEAAKSPQAPDALVIQGIDAGGHGLKKGAGVIALLPEVADALEELGKEITLIGAGGLSDGRGVAAVLATGVAAGAVMGTRFLASTEADIKKGYQDDVVRVSDGGQTTVRTTLFDRLQKRDDWPAQYDGRAIINDSVRDEESGVSLARNKEMFQNSLRSGANDWGVNGRLTSYVGSAVGLVKKVEGARVIVERTRIQAKEVLTETVTHLID